MIAGQTRRTNPSILNRLKPSWIEWWGTNRIGKDAGEKRTANSVYVPTFTRADSGFSNDGADFAAQRQGVRPGLAIVDTESNDPKPVLGLVLDVDDDESGIDEWLCDRKQVEIRKPIVAMDQAADLVRGHCAVDRDVRRHLGHELERG